MQDFTPKYFHTLKRGITNTLCKFFESKFDCVPKYAFQPGKGTYILNWASFKNHIDPKDQIVYNYENLARKFPAVYYQYLERAKEVWDYSEANEKFFPSKFVPIEVYKDPVPQVEKDIKYLFYGAQSYRRSKIITRAKVKHLLHDMPDDELNHYISRSEYVISVSYADENKFNDSARIMPALSKGAKVIAERCDEDDFNQKIEAMGVKVLSYKELYLLK